MDTQTLLTSLTTLGLALVIGMGGEVMKALVRSKPGDTGWRGVYYVTYRAHALVVGALLGWLLHGAIQIPEPFGTAPGGFVLWGASTGAASMVGYDVLVGVIRARIKQLEARS